MEANVDTPRESFLRKIKLKTDNIIPIVVIFLTAISVVMVYSMRGNVVLQHLKHLLFGYIGMFVVYQVDYRRVGVFAPVVLFVAAILLVFTMLSQAVRGVTIFGRDVQTFYFIGFLIIFYISNYIARQYHKHGELNSSNVRYLFLLLGGFCLGIATMNMSTAIILFITGIVIFFVGGFKMKDIAGMIGIVAAVLLVAVIVVANMSDDRKAKIGRMATFINRWEYYITKDNSDG